MRAGLTRDEVPRGREHPLATYWRDSLIEKGDEASYTFAIEVRQPAILDLKGAMIMDSTYFLRQLDMADPSKFKHKPVTVTRASGIGAAVNSPQIPIEDAMQETGNHRKTGRHRG